jgi:hypothetical protein
VEILCGHVCRNALLCDYDGHGSLYAEHVRLLEQHGDDQFYSEQLLHLLQLCQLSQYFQLSQMRQIYLKKTTFQIQL